MKTNSFHSLIKIYYRTSKRFENTFIWLFIATEENPPHDFWIFFPKIIFWEEKIRILQINKSSVKTEGRRDLRQRKFSFQAGRGLRGSRRFPERAASRMEKRREERGKRNPEAKLLRPFLSASQTAAKGNTLYMPTTFPKCSVQFFAATSADPDERVTHVARANTHVPLSSLSLSRARSFCTGCLSRIDRAWGARIRELGRGIDSRVFLKFVFLRKEKINKLRERRVNWKFVRRRRNLKREVLDEG